MTETIESKLEKAGISIPTATAPVANYLGVVQSGNLLYTSGQLPMQDGKIVATGQLGKDVDVETAQQAARVCAINVLSQAKSILGDLGKIKRIVKITVFVASADNFTEQHLVGNGASDLLVEALGDAGKHARAAVGVAKLPFDAAVEVDAIIEIA